MTYRYVYIFADGRDCYWEYLFYSIFISSLFFHSTLLLFSLSFSSPLSFLFSIIPFFLSLFFSLHSCFICLFISLTTYRGFKKIEDTFKLFFPSDIHTRHHSLLMLRKKHGSLWVLASVTYE